MLPLGIVLMILGAVVAFLGVGGSVASLLAGGLFLGLGGWLFTMGFVLAIAGAVVNAIERQTAAVVKELGAARDEYKKGVESLFAQLDRIRSNTVPIAAPAVSPPPPPLLASAPIAPDMGFCPGCSKLRHASNTRCVYCGDMAPPLMAKEST
jgi:hypothetical protein